MKNVSKLFLVVSIALAVAAGAGCSKRQSTYSGFLENYPKFEKGQAGVDKRYIKEGVNFSAYEKIMMDHVTFYFTDEDDYKGIHPDELKELSDAFHKAMVEALQDAYPLVEEPGPGVLRVRTAITKVQKSKPALNTITAIVPIGLGISLVKKGVTGTHTFVGLASIEAELLDSQTNERLAAVIDTKTAEKYKVVKGMHKLGHAEDAFKFWAKRLRTWLDEQHGK